MSGEERVLDRFEGARRLRDDEWMVLCPAHGDRNPSLHVTHREGRWLLFCHAGCSLEDVLARAGLEQRDLFDERGDGHREIEAVYTYHDERGAALFEVVRFMGKQFRQRTPDGSWGLNGTRRVLYRLPKVLEAVALGERVWIAEGEKDAIALAKLGVAATTNPMGAGKWRPKYSEALRGAKVTIVADRDGPGRDHARAVAHALEGVAAEVAVLEPPQDKDVSDHIANGGAIEELVELESYSSTRRSAVDKQLSGLPFTPWGT
jgi:5S rRNA maturation endonuclease (ribonuclease M5)